MRTSSRLLMRLHYGYSSSATPPCHPLNKEQSTVCDECGENLESATAIKDHFKVYHAGKEIVTKSADDVRSNAKGRRNKSAPTKSLSS